MERQVAVIEPAVIQACAPDELRVAQRTGNANIDIARARSHQFCVRGEERREVQGAVQPQIEAGPSLRGITPLRTRLLPSPTSLNSSTRTFCSDTTNRILPELCSSYSLILKRAPSISPLNVSLDGSENRPSASRVPSRAVLSSFR